MAEAGRHAVDENVAAGMPMRGQRPRRVFGVGIGDMQRQVIGRVRKAIIYDIDAFGRAAVAATVLRPLGVASEGDRIGFEHDPTAQQLQLPLGLEDEDAIGLAGRLRRGRGGWRRQREQRQQTETEDGRTPQTRHRHHFLPDASRRQTASRR